MAEIHPSKFNQLNAPLCDISTFTPDTLSAFSERYRDQSLPSFLLDVVRDDADSSEATAYRENPELRRFSDCDGFLIIPNYPYFDIEDYARSPDTYKLRPQGLAISTWYIHPGIGNIKQAGQTENGLPEKSVGEIEKTNGSYLASVLDLTVDHVDWLILTANETLKYAQEVFGVDGSDSIRLYSHNILHPSSATLHLHLTVNQGIHPKELEEIIWLDELIAGLRAGESPSDMIMESTEGKFHFVHNGGLSSFMCKLPASER